VGYHAVWDTVPFRLWTLRALALDGSFVETEFVLNVGAHTSTEHARQSARPLACHLRCGIGHTCRILRRHPGVYVLHGLVLEPAARTPTDSADADAERSDSDSKCEWCFSLASCAVCESVLAMKARYCGGRQCGSAH
jgi:hypothetical protein